MKATIENVAYSIFFSAFSVWAGLLVADVTMTNSLGFSNTLMSTAFMIFGGIAGVSCGIVGLSFLGVSFNLKNKISFKTEKVNDVIVEENKPTTLKVQRKKKIKTQKFSKFEISPANNTLKKPKKVKPKGKKMKNQDKQNT